MKALFLITPFITDPAITIIRRFINKEVSGNLTNYIFIRLVSAGMSHSKVSLIYIFSVILLSIFYLFFSLIHLAILSLALVIIGFFLDSKFALSFKKSNNKVRKLIKTHTKYNAKIENDILHINN